MSAASARELDARGRRTRYELLAVLISVGSLAVFGYLATHHRICTYRNSDFYGTYAPDAERIEAGIFPTSRFQGPGYPLALALIRPLAGDLFTAGKAISVLSAALAGFLAFVLFRDPWGDVVGLGALLLLISNPVFARLAVEPVTDMPFLMLCMAAEAVFLAPRFRVPWRVGGAAALASIAFLTRYNGVFLVVAFALSMTLLNLFETSWPERFRLLALFTLVSLSVAAPWLYANDRHRGSPLYNENYLNIATTFYGQSSADGTSGDGTQAMAVRFHSFRDVVAYDPIRLLTRYPVSLARNLVRSFGSWPMGIASVMGLVIAWTQAPPRRVLSLGVAVVLFYLLMALNHFEARYYLFATAVYAALSALALQTIVSWLATRLDLRPKTATTAAVAALILAAAVGASGAARLLNRMYAEEPREIFGACAYLRDRGIRDSPILAYKPHVAFVCGQEAVYLPPLESEVDMERWILGSRARFLAIGPDEIRRRPQIASWHDPARAPAWLRPVWSHERLSLYEIGRRAP
jgi:hypothetical protein